MSNSSQNILNSQFKELLNDDSTSETSFDEYYKIGAAVIYICCSCEFYYLF